MQEIKKEDNFNELCHRCGCSLTEDNKNFVGIFDKNTPIYLCNDCYKKFEKKNNHCNKCECDLTEDNRHQIGTYCDYIPIYLCQDCFIKLDNEIIEETKNINILGAIFYGILTSIIGSIILLIINKLHDDSFNFIILAYIIGIAVSAGAGHKRGAVIQLLSAIIIIFAFLLPKIALISVTLITKFGTNFTEIFDFIHTQQGSDLLINLIVKDLTLKKIIILFISILLSIYSNKKRKRLTN